MSWQVEILNETVAAEIRALPPDIQARFLRLGDQIRLTGLESLQQPHGGHLATVSLGSFTSPPSVGES